MRIALFSDIHGNSIALDAVLDDIDSLGGVDGYWLLGDFVAIGFDPVGVLERISRLDNAIFVRGNTDRYILTGDRPSPTLDQVVKDIELLPTFADVIQSFSWTHGSITSSGWMDWLRELVLEHKTTLPDGTGFEGVHASPGNDDGIGIHPGVNEDDLRVLLSGTRSGLLCVGHTHTPLEVHLDGKHIINIGSISNPFPPDLRASYVVLEANRERYQTHFRYVPYDREAVIDFIHRVDHPTVEYLTKFMRGEIEPLWKLVMKSIN